MNIRKKVKHIKIQQIWIIIKHMFKMFCSEMKLNYKSEDDDDDDEDEGGGEEKSLRKRSALTRAHFLQRVRVRARVPK